VDLPPLLPDREARVPLAVQLADGLRGAARTGTVRVGDRLPSTRALATELGVSRTVTAAAYDQLLAEGWVAGRRGAGTFVVAVPPGVLEPTVDPPRARPPQLGPVDLRAGTPCVEALDPAAWRRAWRAASDDPPDVLPDAVGLPAFRAAVVAHLLRHRGLPADPCAVLATGGTTAAVGELARTLPRGARVAVEEPGYQRAAAGGGRA
jgi:GntR family transcriptional regulator / MocR family aminotransferase